MSALSVICYHTTYQHVNQFCIVNWWRCIMRGQAPPTSPRLLHFFVASNRLTSLWSVHSLSLLAFLSFRRHQSRINWEKKRERGPPSLIPAPFSCLSTFGSRHEIGFSETLDYCSSLILNRAHLLTSIFNSYFISLQVRTQRRRSVHECDDFASRRTQRLRDGHPALGRTHCQGLAW